MRHKGEGRKREKVEIMKTLEIQYGSGFLSKTKKYFLLRKWFICFLMGAESFKENYGAEGSLTNAVFKLWSSFTL